MPLWVQSAVKQEDQHLLYMERLGPGASPSKTFSCINYFLKGSEYPARFCKIFKGLGSAVYDHFSLGKLHSALFDRQLHLHS